MGGPSVYDLFYFCLFFVLWFVGGLDFSRIGPICTATMTTMTDLILSGAGSGATEIFDLVADYAWALFLDVRLAPASRPSVASEEWASLQRVTRTFVASCKRLLVTTFDDQIFNTVVLDFIWDVCGQCVVSQKGFAVLSQTIDGFVHGPSGQRHTFLVRTGTYHSALCRKVVLCFGTLLPHRGFGFFVL